MVKGYYRTTLPTAMIEPRVLDTSALISWAVDSLEGGYVVRKQREEVRRVAPDRAISVEAARLNWTEPTLDSLERAREIASETGDLDGLSETDLEIFALLIQTGGHLFSDDYRLQNLCVATGMSWSAVDSEGISGIWNWQIRCSACGDVVSGHGRTRRAGEGLGECEKCGSEMKISRKR